MTYTILGRLTIGAQNRIKKKEKETMNKVYTSLVETLSTSSVILSIIISINIIPTIDCLAQYCASSKILDSYHIYVLHLSTCNNGESAHTRITFQVRKRVLGDNTVSLKLRLCYLSRFMIMALIGLLFCSSYPAIRPTWAHSSLHIASN